MMDESEIARKVLEVVPATMRLLRTEFRAASKSEFTIPQHRIMAHIFRGINTANGLAEQQGVSLPAISKLIDSLVRRRLIRRRFEEGDRRQVFLELTDMGRKQFLNTRSAAQKKILLRILKLEGRTRVCLAEGLLALERVLAVDNP